MINQKLQETAVFTIAVIMAVFLYSILFICPESDQKEPENVKYPAFTTTIIPVTTAPATTTTGSKNIRI